MNTKTPQPGKTVGKTRREHDQGLGQPRLPHEHDESADSQHSEPRDIIKQAHDDVESGQEDTDLRGSQGRRDPAVPRGTPRKKQP